MSRIPRIDDLGSIIRDIRIRLERLERGKAIVGGSGNSQGLQDPTILTGDMIVRDQGGIDRLAIGAVGTFLQVKNLGNFANVLLNLNPYLWYRLNEASGTTMADSSQSGAHSGLYSAAGVSYHVAPPTGDGDFAVTFNGSTGYAHVGANPTGGGDFSVAFFYKSGAVGLDLPAIGTSGGVFGNPPSWEFVPGGEAGDGRPEFAFTTGTSFGSPIGGSLRFNSGPSITDGNWHQIVMTRVMSTGVVTIYVDGSAISVSVVNASDSVISNAIMAGSALNGGSDMFMGAATATTAFCPCSLDEVATWQRVLSAAEVAHLYAQTPGAAAPTPAWGALPAFMTNPMTTQDDIIIGSAAGAPARLGKGTTGYVLTVDPTTGHIVWAASAAGFSDPTTTKGDLIVHGTSTTRLPVGTDGQVLTARSTAANGVDWEAAGGGGGGTNTNEDNATVLTNATSTGDAGSRADHFLGTSLGAAWTAAGTAVASVGKSSMAIQQTVSGAGWVHRPYTPTGAFRIEARCAVGFLGAGTGLLISTTGTDTGDGILVNIQSNAIAFYSLDAGAYTQRAGITMANPLGQWLYYALARDGANNWTGYVSADRGTWKSVGTYTKTFTVAKLGFRINNGSALNDPCAHDFIDVVS